VVQCRLALVRGVHNQLVSTCAFKGRIPPCSSRRYNKQRVLLISIGKCPLSGVAGETSSGGIEARVALEKE
jgi:hypothetical protein